LESVSVRASLTLSVPVFVPVASLTVIGPLK